MRPVAKVIRSDTGGLAVHLDVLRLILTCGAGPNEGLPIPWFADLSGLGAEAAQMVSESTNRVQSRCGSEP